MTERQFQGVETLPLARGLPYIRPPSAILEYLFGGKNKLARSWGLLDANWSPDFPTSARDAIRLYRHDGGTGQIDGVLGVTTYTIDELLKLTGPISVPEYDVTVATGETTLKTLQQTRVAPDPGTSRKAFLSAFADRLVDSLLALPLSTWTNLVANDDTFQAQHLILAWFGDAAPEALMVRLGMDGAIRMDPGDYVFPVDSNVSPVSKLSVVTSREIHLDVSLDDAGNATDALTMRWTNRIEEPAELPYTRLPRLESLTTLGMYFRAYVPEGSRFRDGRHRRRCPVDGPVRPWRRGRPDVRSELPPHSSGFCLAFVCLDQPEHDRARSGRAGDLPADDPEAARRIAGTAPRANHPAARGLRRRSGRRCVRGWRCRHRQRLVRPGRRRRSSLPPWTGGLRWMPVKRSP